MPLVELVFKALADPSRRLLLDRLFERDGQTLRQLCVQVDMTRFGVMKHLRVLETAGLVITRRSGRAKLHFLNPVPIRLLHDRWINKYAEPWVGALGDLKRELEEETMSGMRPARGPSPPNTPAREQRGAPHGPRHVHEVYIRIGPERLWEALTRSDYTRDYFYGTLVESTWKEGDPLVYRYPDGRPAAEGAVLEADPPRRLVHTFSALWDEAVTPDPPHQVTWTIEPLGPACKLTVEHAFDRETATLRSVRGGLPVILDGLKTLLETGEPLVLAR